MTPYVPGGVRDRELLVGEGINQVPYTTETQGRIGIYRNLR